MREDALRFVDQLSGFRPATAPPGLDQSSNTTDKPQPSLPEQSFERRLRAFSPSSYLPANLIESQKFLSLRIVVRKSFLNDLSMGSIHHRVQRGRFQAVPKLLNQRQPFG